MRRATFASPQDFTASTGATWTSGRRTVRGNAAVRGVEGSEHIPGNAADFTPAKGQSLQQLAAQARRTWPDARVIIESDHVHVQQPGWGVPYHGRRGTQ